MKKNKKNFLRNNHFMEKLFVAKLEV